MTSPSTDVPFDLDDGRALLARTPAALDGLLRGLPAVWSDARDGDGTWSPHEVVGHLINADRTDWITRAQVILAGDATATFPPFDRTGFFPEARAMPLGALLDLFAGVRAEALATLDSWKLTDDLLRLTARHPQFGAVTLSQLLATWVAHDMNHVVQIARTMARRYETAVGPWGEYLGVMHRRTP